MSKVISGSASPPVPSLSDLTTVSLDAAIQLDRILHGRTPDYVPLRRLSDSLRAASDVLPGGTALSLQYNPTALGVLSRAVERSDKRILDTVVDLTKEIAEFVDMLSKEPAAWDKETTERSLSFCLSLHRELVAEASQSDVIVPSDDWTGERSWIT
jgi:hypothetical protein